MSAAHGFDAELGSFVQAYGSKALDASLLLMPLVGFLPPTIRASSARSSAIERRLLVDGFVMRYDTGEVLDGLPPGEGAFLACSFWLADNYMPAGAHAEARELFERLLSLRNDVGLLAEEYDPRAAAGRQFPAGLLARRAGQHRVQPDPRARPRRGARHQRAPCPQAAHPGDRHLRRCAKVQGGKAQRLPPLPTQLSAECARAFSPYGCFIGAPRMRCATPRRSRRRHGGRWQSAGHSG